MGKQRLRGPRPRDCLGSGGARVDSTASEPWCWASSPGDEGASRWVMGEAELAHLMWWVKGERLGNVSLTSLRNFVVRRKERAVAAKGRACGSQWPLEQTSQCSCLQCSCLAHSRAQQGPCLESHQVSAEPAACSCGLLGLRPRRGQGRQVSAPRAGLPHVPSRAFLECLHESLSISGSLTSSAVSLASGLLPLSRELPAVKGSSD